MKLLCYIFGHSNNNVMAHCGNYTCHRCGKMLFRRRSAGFAERMNAPEEIAPSVTHTKVYGIALLKETVE